MNEPKISISHLVLAFGAGAVFIVIVVLLGGKITGLSIGGAVIGFPTDIPTSQPSPQPTTVVQQVPQQPRFTEVSAPTIVPSQPTSPIVPTPKPLPTVQMPPTPAQIQMDGPFREQRGAAVGTGVFTQVTLSDGNASFSQDDLNTNHYRIQRIRPEENPDGCGVSGYNTEKVWFGSSANSVFTVNGKEVGRLSVDTGRHGYIANWSVRVGDRVCAVGFAPSGYHIVMGPDLYYHYDSYCYRGNC